MRILSAVLFVCLSIFGVAAFAADPQQPAAEKPSAPAEIDAKTAQRYAKLEEMLTNVKLIGNFTVLGREAGDLPTEEYTIKSAKKLEAGDLWLLQARIKYGNKDLALPLPLEIKWAGDTPVITLTKVTIPGLGEFSSRVVLYNGKYAGTWTHDKVGGHLFGVIEKIEGEEAAPGN